VEEGEEGEEGDGEEEEEGAEWDSEEGAEPAPAEPQLSEAGYKVTREARGLPPERPKLSLHEQAAKNAKRRAHYATAEQAAHREARKAAKKMRREMAARGEELHDEFS
jgi:hypothetical protein